MTVSARLLQVLSLLQARPSSTGQELADRLGVSARTVRSDVDKLRELGYPVHAVPGVAGGYRLAPGAKLPPLLLDDDEATAVAIGLNSAAGGAVAGIEEAATRALAKLEQVLPSRLRHRMRPRTPTGPRFTPREPPEQDLAAYVAKGVDAALARYRARVLVHKSATELVQWLPPAMAVEAVDDHSCLVHTGADTPHMLAANILVIDADFEVDGPPELLDALRTIGHRCHATRRQR